MLLICLAWPRGWKLDRLAGAAYATRARAIGASSSKGMLSIDGMPFRAYTDNWELRGAERGNGLVSDATSESLSCSGLSNGGSIFVVVSVDGPREENSRLGSSLIRSMLSLERTCRFTFTFKLPMNTLTFRGVDSEVSTASRSGREVVLPLPSAPLIAEQSPADTAERTVLVILGRYDS